MRLLSMVILAMLGSSAFGQPAVAFFRQALQDANIEATNVRVQFTMNPVVLGSPLMEWFDKQSQKYNEKKQAERFYRVSYEIGGITQDCIGGLGRLRDFPTNQRIVSLLFCNASFWETMVGSGYSTFERLTTLR